jgi:protein ImuA
MTPIRSDQKNCNRIKVMHELRCLLPRLEGVQAEARALGFGLPVLEAHLPQGGLTFGALHEVVPAAEADTAAAFGFVAALLGSFLGSLPRSAPLLLVMPARGFAQFGRPHGHGLHRLGLDPARLILVETRQRTQTLWALEEALRSGAPAAVAGAVEELDLKTSQRLHFAARVSGLPLLLMRPARTLEASVAATRWRVGTAEAARDRFGLFARWRWRLALERCRNGRPGEWLVEFDHVSHRFSLAAALADPAFLRSADARSCA